MTKSSIELSAKKYVGQSSIHQMIFGFLFIVRLVQSQREEELGEEVENLDATEDGEAREESHRATDQAKSSNKGHL